MCDDVNFVVILIGDAAVGKTALFRKWGFTEYDGVTTPTLSPELLTKNVRISGDVVRISLWDTGVRKYVPFANDPQLDKSSLGQSQETITEIQLVPL